MRLLVLVRFTAAPAPRTLRCCCLRALLNVITPARSRSEHGHFAQPRAERRRVDALLARTVEVDDIGLQHRGGL